MPGAPQYIGMASGKNMPLSPAVSDLGLGDQLVQQVQDDDEERKRKLLAQADQMKQSQSAALALSPGVASMMGGSISGLK